MQIRSFWASCAPPDAGGAWAAGTRLPTGSDGERVGRLVADITGHALLEGGPSARVRGARVPTGPRLVARAVAVDLESNTRSSRCSSARRFAGLAQLSECGAG